jgi:TRAP-type uncharacterized transport system substrate-binding protein
VLYPNYTQVATIEGKSINRLADLRGRVVSTGLARQRHRGDRVPRAARRGIDPDKDIHKQSLSVNASVDALKDGKIDAFFWSGGLPTASLLDLASTVGITAKLIPTTRCCRSCRSSYTPGSTSGS